MYTLKSRNNCRENLLDSSEFQLNCCCYLLKDVTRCHLQAIWATDIAVQYQWNSSKPVVSQTNIFCEVSHDWPEPAEGALLPRVTGIRERQVTKLSCMLAIVLPLSG